MAIGRPLMKRKAEGEHWHHAANNVAPVSGKNIHTNTLRGSSSHGSDTDIGLADFFYKRHFHGGIWIDFEHLGLLMRYQSVLHWQLCIAHL